MPSPEVGRRPLCLVSPHRDGAPPTFVTGHIAALPAPVLVLSGGYFPIFRDDGRSLLPWPQRAVSGIVARIAGIAPRRLELSVFRRYPIGWQRALLRRYLRRTRPFTVLAEFGPTGVAVMRPCAAAGVPLVVHFHGYDAYAQPTLAAAGRQYQELFATAAAVVAVSQDMVTQLVRLGAPAAKVHLNPCGADTALFRPRDTPVQAPVILSVGRFVAKKAPHLVLRAFHRVHAKIPEARLIMLGDGPLLEPSRKLAGALELGNAVEFRGACRHDEVARAMGEARVLVHHAVRTPDGDMEGTPVAVLEAGAAGLPVVATRHGGIPDVVRHGETGFLVSEGDVDGTAHYLTLLSDDATLGRALGRRARDHVCGQYSLGERTRRLGEILGAVAGSSAAGVASP